MAEQEVVGQMTFGDETFDQLSPREDGPHNGDIMAIKHPDGSVTYGFIVKMGQFGGGRSFFNPVYPPPPVDSRPHGDLDVINGEKVYLRRPNTEDQNIDQDTTRSYGGDPFQQAVARAFYEALAEKLRRDQS